MIIVDTNAAEDGVFEALRRGCDAADDGDRAVVRRRLDVGDVLVTSGEDQEPDGRRTICLERKRWDDLAASVCDGRWREQKARMLPTPGLRYAYVVEGAAVEGWGGAHRGGHGVRHKALWAALVKTQLRDGMPVFHTRSPEDTAALCAYLHEQLHAGLGTTTEAAAPPVVIAGTASCTRKRSNLEDGADALRAMLAILPGMSAARAHVVVAECGNTAADVAATSTARLSDIVCGTRRLGPKTAARIKAAFGGPP